MTCIVGVVENGTVYIGGDSAGSNSIHQLTIRKDKKVFRNGDFLIAGTGPFRLIQLLRYSFEPPKRETDDIERYMATTFVDAIRECFKAGGYAWKSSERESFEGKFLIGYQNRLFIIEGDYQVEEATYPYNAVGSGTDVALGVLYATPDIQAMKRVELALKAAEQHNTTVRAPFHIEVLEPVKSEAIAS